MPLTSGIAAGHRFRSTKPAMPDGVDIAETDGRAARDITGSPRQEGVRDGCPFHLRREVPGRSKGRRYDHALARQQAYGRGGGAAGLSLGAARALRRERDRWMVRLHDDL